MRIAPGLMALVASALTGTARAQVRTDKPFRSSLALGGSYVAGNVGQASIHADARLSHSVESLGYDVLASAFRLWVRPAPGRNLVRAGDTLAVTALPFWYFSEHWFVLGTGRFEHSRIRGLEGRTNGGAGIGYAPIRREDRLLRGALGAQWERTRFISSDLSPAWAGDEAKRRVARAGLQSNGWLRVEESGFSLQYVGGLFVNPSDPRDFRGFLDGSVSVDLVQQLSLQVGGSLLHDTVVPTGIQPTDLRVTMGLSWARPSPSG